MLELSEAKTLAKQLNERVKGLSVAGASALVRPHKFCWLNLDNALFEEALRNRVVVDAVASAGFVRLVFDDQSELAWSEDIDVRWFANREEAGIKHQLLLFMSDGSALKFSVKLYGFLFVGPIDVLRQNHYVRIALDAVDPLDEQFTFERFLMQTELNTMKGTLKQALATEQRIPGLGNGTLQDVLFAAKLSPRRKTSTLNEFEKQSLYVALKTSLDAMTQAGGKDGWNDLDGHPGGYRRVMRNDATACPACGANLRKEAYLGGNVIYCPSCQK